MRMSSFNIIANKHTQPSLLTASLSYDPLETLLKRSQAAPKVGKVEGWFTYCCRMSAKNDVIFNPTMGTNVHSYLSLTQQLPSSILSVLGSTPTSMSSSP